MAKKKAKSKKGGGSKSASPSNASRSREEQPAGGGSAAFSPLLWKAGFVLGAPVPASFREDAYADECKGEWKGGERGMGEGGGNEAY